MTVLQLERHITYGPVYSRRLGRSLGINLLPAEQKVCSFDCSYCHYGPTDVCTLRPRWEGFPRVQEVVTALRAALRRHADVDYLTFSGNGEPTLHPHFPAIVAEVEALRAALAPRARLAIFSNSTTAGREEIRRALARCDVPIMKLDAVEDELFAHINRPVSGISPASVVESLKALPRLVIQTVFIDGPLSNYEGAPFEAWVGALQRLRPLHVQIYSTDRPVADPGVQRVLPYVLERLATAARERTGLDVKAYYF